MPVKGGVMSTRDGKEIREIYVPRLVSQLEQGDPNYGTKRRSTRVLDV